mmetsp:Transcript_42900/g.107198  ORF Transcript_42900/g.107198 Transcript_42900/m.107198 type:complete len:334 (-) Transcript_42900:100-1101(-)
MRCGLQVEGLHGQLSRLARTDVAQLHHRARLQPIERGAVGKHDCCGWPCLRERNRGHSFSRHNKGRGHTRRSSVVPARLPRPSYGPLAAAAGTCRAPRCRHCGCPITFHRGRPRHGDFLCPDWYRGPQDADECGCCLSARHRYEEADGAHCGVAPRRQDLCGRHLCRPDVCRATDKPHRVRRAPQQDTNVIYRRVPSLCQRCVWRLPRLSRLRGGGIWPRPRCRTAPPMPLRTHECLPYRPVHTRGMAAPQRQLLSSDTQWSGGACSSEGCVIHHPQAVPRGHPAGVRSTAAHRQGQAGARLGRHTQRDRPRHSCPQTRPRGCHARTGQQADR